MLIFKEADRAARIGDPNHLFFYTLEDLQSLTSRLVKKKMPSDSFSFQHDSFRTNLRGIEMILQRCFIATTDILS